MVRSKAEKDAALKKWIYQQYLAGGFTATGFKGFKWLQNRLIIQRPDSRKRIVSIMSELRSANADEPYAFGHVADVHRALQAGTLVAQTSSELEVPKRFTRSSVIQDSSLSHSLSPSSTRLETRANTATFKRLSTPKDVATEPPSEDTQVEDLLSRQLKQLHWAAPSAKKESKSNESNSEDSMVHSDAMSVCHGDDHSGAYIDSNANGMVRSNGNHVQDTSSPSSNAMSIDDDYNEMLQLLTGQAEHGSEDRDEQSREAQEQARNAVLLDESVLRGEERHLLPQYGLLGLHQSTDRSSMLFLNTNNPFSAFICGVQGSGKSHTTACILENALIRAPCLGKLRNPLSALVFSYGQFSGDGSGFNISEAAFLAMPDSNNLDSDSVPKVHVYVSPSNFTRIAKLYTRIPNVKVTSFKLKPRNLDIDVMLTLMNVNESEEQPLYMASVIQILREIATAGGPFDYLIFRKRVYEQNFAPAQINMLQIRLNLLESFLDLRGDCPEPQFEPGEITIIDMSCPFIDANTACILFKIALQRYLQSDVAGKMVVLDEAHKYMIRVPGAKALNEKLLEVIRLQRHYGARVVISTQEPTLLTDLIALCSITIAHRFSSPEWLAALKRHIHIKAEDQLHLMDRIATLATGTALVYAPTAALGKDDKGGILNGTGRMIEVKMRKRITSDGGQSVLAV